MKSFRFGLYALIVLVGAIFATNRTIATNHDYKCPSSSTATECFPGFVWHKSYYEEWSSIDRELDHYLRWNRPTRKTFESYSKIAQLGQIPNYVIPAPSGGGYTGPGDIQTTGTIVWWGLRAYSAATRGTPALNLCDDTGANCSDVLTNATTGALNNPGTHGTNNCATSGTCRVFIMYDQSGANNCSGPCNINTSTTSNPTLLWNCISAGVPCIQFVKANSQYLTQTVGAATIAQPFTFSSVANRTGSTSSVDGIAWISGPNFIRQLAYDSTTRVYIFPGSSNVNSATVTNNAWHAFQGVFSGANSLVNLDGTNGTISGDAANTSGIAPISMGMGQDGFSNFFDGDEVEFGAWTGAFSSGTSSSMSANQHSFWGF